MRTTISLDDDVTAAVQKLRQEDGLGLSEAVNRLARAGMSRPAEHAPYRHRACNIGIKVDVSNIGAVLDLLDET